MGDAPVQHMQCMEDLERKPAYPADSPVWNSAGSTPAWVYSKPFGESRHGGDIYYASSCATGRITRLLVADVAGHGSTVADTATGLRTLMRRFVNRLDQGEFVRLLNRQFSELSQAGTFASCDRHPHFSKPDAAGSLCATPAIRGL